ncbi:hypothetical protein ACNHUS_25945 [Actinomycetes bacterium M1A6_2h]
MAYGNTGFTTLGLFHLTSVVEDLDETASFYERVFGIDTTTVGYEMHRWARFSRIGDVLIDNMCPDHRFDTAVRQYLLLAGERFTFPALYVTDMHDFIYKMQARGFRLTSLKGQPVDTEPPIVQLSPHTVIDALRIVVTHPWDTGVQFEIVEVESDFARQSFVAQDPRFDDDWIPEVPPANALGAQCASHHTLVVDDPRACVDFLVEVCGGEVVLEKANTLLGAQSTYVEVGTWRPTVFELAVPVQDGPLRQEHERVGNSHYMTTFSVEGLAEVRAHLTSVGCDLELDSSHHVVIAPRHAHGMRFGFTDRKFSDAP